MPAWPGFRVATLAALLIAPPLFAQTADEEKEQEQEIPTSEVLGRLVDQATLRPVVGAVVRFSGRDTLLEQMTDSIGRFLFEAVPAGTHLFEVEHIAYGVQADSLRIVGGRSLDMRVQIAMDPVELAPLTVVVRSPVLVNAGFYNRREDGFGEFLTRDDLAGRAPTVLSLVVGSLAGVRKIPGRFGTYQLRMARSALSGRCRIQYFLDGVPTLLGPIGIDEIPTYDVEGLEVYRGASEIPPQFNTGNALCGVIVVWTRIQ